MVKLKDKFQGHLILYCKGHYKTKDFFEGLKMIWAVRCGYNYKDTSEYTIRYIADDMYNIIKTTSPERLDYLMNILHREIGHELFWKPENMTPIESMVWEYRGILNNLQVRESDGKGGFIDLIELPKPQKRIFNRILRGNGRFEDYDLINSLN